MINNRQNGRRGRGRNGVRPQGGGTGRPEQGNRIDNRARGNAAQLLEKYKALARDAQMSGDRVMTEYYLQFADHYFRVLADSRARFDEQRRPQGEQAQPGGANSFQDEYDGDDGDADITDSFDDPRPDQQPRYQNQNRNDNRGDGDRYNNQRNDNQRNDGPRNDGQDRNRQDRQPRQDRDGQDRSGQDRGERAQNDRPQNGDGQQNGYQQDRGPRQDRGDRQDRPFRARDNQRDQNDGHRQDRQPRPSRDDGQERGLEGQTYRTIRAEPDRGPVPSPLAAQSAPAPVRDDADQGQGDTAPRRQRTRRPVTETQPLTQAETPAPVAATPEPVLERPEPAVEEAPRRTRRARVTTPVETDGHESQSDMLTLPPAFLSTPADAAPAEEKPRRRRRTRAEIDADNGDVAA